MGSPRRAPRLGWPPAWSFTLHHLLQGPQRCERAVYWRYGAAAAGASAPPESDEHRAWVLSRLTTLPLLLGVTVHTAARAVLLAVRDGDALPAYGDLLAGARFTLNHVWLTSTRQPDRFFRWPGVYPALQEVIYRGALREVEVARARWALAMCLEHLLAAPLLDDLRRCRAGDIVVGDAPVAFQPLRGIDAWAALDAAYLHHDPATCGGLVSAPTWCIVDIKTGAPPATEASAARDAADHALQLAVYAMLASEVLGLPATDGVYLGRLVHLRQQSDTWFRITADDIERARRSAGADIAWLRSRADDAGDDGAGDGGLPPKSRFALSRDRRCCTRCPFLALCEDELAG